MIAARIQSPWRGWENEGVEKLAKRVKLIYVELMLWTDECFYNFYQKIV